MSLWQKVQAALAITGIICIVGGVIITIAHIIINDAVSVVEAMLNRVMYESECDQYDENEVN